MTGRGGVVGPRAASDWMGCAPPVVGRAASRCGCCV